MAAGCPSSRLSDTNEDVTVYNLRIEEYHTYFRRVRGVGV